MPGTQVSPVEMRSADAFSSHTARVPANYVTEETSPWPTRRWLDYFQHNASNLFDVPWDLGPELRAAERAAIATSLQGFQRGESSEGRHMLQCAQNYARAHDDPAYVDVIRLFIREEQRHARDLGRFLSGEGIPLLESSWPDTVFRWLRHRAGLELSICVLVTAEVFAMVYYAALREATRSVVLRRLCEQILRDEVAHIRFQSERLALLRQRRSRWYVHIAQGLQRFLFLGTLCVVWQGHRQALRAGGFGFRRFWSAAWRELRVAMRAMDPHTR